jgi:hypothetical protein
MGCSGVDQKGREGRGGTGLTLSIEDVDGFSVSYMLLILILTLAGWVALSKLSV